MPASGLTMTSPVAPSSPSMSGEAAKTPAAWTTAGIPSCAARIAVWEVTPPASVTMPSTRAGSRVAVSAGARSSATMMLGSSNSGTPGAGRPSSRAAARWKTSRRSLCLSAM